ncbi:hypothetical protein E8D34_04075 [Nocardioides sp. GY 10113]|uniref:hypothetical protein n=1 Tax=Nocardioides sp. GY 10113 TaxID=2569761 RepID=UPI0010A7FC74|nr:hypothetical protein [Nocardioides sp. GY 10113]TIC88840.1 hypothetical protein E8D34_04075 [Nocardioides sp. GY 10113]
MIRPAIRLRRRRRDDSGTVLIIALIVVTTVALVTGALLSHSGAAMSATVALQGVADRSYAADAAAQVAINDLRLGGKAPGITAPDPDGDGPAERSDWVYTDAGDGAGCFGLDGSAARDVLRLDGVASDAGSAARVECTKVAGTGLYGSGGGVEQNAQNTFPRALTAFGGDISYDGGGLLQIRGGMKASSAITVKKYRQTVLYWPWILQSFSPATLATSRAGEPVRRCTGDSFTTPVTCPLSDGGGAGAPVVADALTDLTARPLRDPSSVTASGGVCAFEPGYYDNATTLSNKVNSCSTSWFKPGLYYFDFQNELSEALGNGLMGGDNVWRITGNRTVIGGTRPPGNPTAIPGACVSPLSDHTAAGVRFVFGGNSRMQADVPVSASTWIRYNETPKVELCGSYSATEPPVVVQQQTNGAAAPTTATTPTSVTAPPTTVSGTGSTPAFANATQAALDPGNTAAGAATWTSTAVGQKAALALSGFGPSTAPPAGSVLRKATLSLALTAPSTGVKVTPSAGGTTGTTATLTGSGDVDVTSLLAAAVHDGTLAAAGPSAALAFTATAVGQKVTVDSASLRLDYYAPNVHAGSLPVGGDPLLKVYYPWISGYPGNWPRFVVNGAIYARNGDVSLEFGLTLGTAYFGPMVSMRGGVAARSIDLIGGQWGRYGYPLASIPDLGVGVGNLSTVVDLKVYVCAEAASCASGGRHALTVRVKITDPAYGDDELPEAGNRRIQVLSWAEQ